MITFEDVQEFITAEHIYADLTQGEIDAINQAKYDTTVNGVRVIGVSIAIDELSEKELFAAITVEDAAV
jgi:hypothetical protein